MAIGKKIRFFRNLRGITQKQLGVDIGFSEKTADIRIAQYESEARYPKDETLALLADSLDVSPLALANPNIDNIAGVMHILFTMEDFYGLRIREDNGEACLCIDAPKNKDATALQCALQSWKEATGMFKNGEISKEDYDNWRYRYPETNLQKHNTEDGLG